MSIYKHEVRLERYEYEDHMRLGLNRMDEFDRGYYEDNPWCYSWEIDTIPLDETYYDELMEDEEEEEEEFIHLQEEEED